MASVNCTVSIFYFATLSSVDSVYASVSFATEDAISITLHNCA